MGFKQDSMLIIDTMKLKQKFNYNIIVETGTNKGDSIDVLQHIFDKVYSCELDIKYFPLYKRFSSNSNIKILRGNSVECLQQFFNEIGHDKFFIFLDAHWGSWPINEELKIIAKFNFKPVIIIHDFDCGYENWGFEKYLDENNNTIYLNWSHIRNNIELIYGKKGFKKHVSKESFMTGVQKRGAIYIYPTDNINNESKII